MAGQPQAKPILITGLCTLVSHSRHVPRFVRKNARTACKTQWYQVKKLQTLRHTGYFPLCMKNIPSSIVALPSLSKKTGVMSNHLDVTTKTLNFLQLYYDPECWSSQGLTPPPPPWAKHARVGMGKEVSIATLQVTTSLPVGSVGKNK